MSRQRGHDGTVLKEAAVRLDSTGKEHSKISSRTNRLPNTVCGLMNKGWNHCQCIITLSRRTTASSYSPLSTKKLDANPELFFVKEYLRTRITHCYDMCRRSKWCQRFAIEESKSFVSKQWHMTGSLKS